MRLIAVLAAVALALAATGATEAQFFAPGTPIVHSPLPAIGSRDQVVTIAPLVPRPGSRACVVELFRRREFSGPEPHPLVLTPPAGCPGPWARIVLENDFEMTAGSQYDRSARLTIAGVTLYTGTTMEPRESFGPRWHVERDVTDYAAILARPAPGQADLQNYTDDRHQGRLFWRARLVFYNADRANPAPRTPDIVTPISDGVVKLTREHPTVTHEVTWPRNVERMAIDVMVMPQETDEMWQSCIAAAALPEAFRDEDPCIAPFRESEVRIDGALAGFAPVFPWIFTGGMGAWNWTSVPGIGTLDLSPYRVDLTPFAGRMNDGKPHRIELTAAGARNYMAATATLLGWLDAGRGVVRGTVTRNTLAPTRLAIAGNLLDARAKGSAVTVNGTRAGRVAGYVETSHGRVVTRIDGSMAFKHRIRARGMEHDTEQETTLDTRTVVTGGGVASRRHVIERYPLSRGRAIDPGSTRKQSSDLDQGLFRDESVTDARGTIRRTIRQSVSPRIRSMQKGKLFPSDVETTASIRIDDSREGCYDRTVAVRERTVTRAEDRCR